MSILPMHSRFPWRQKLYRIDGHLPLTNRHVILPDCRILVVRRWEGRVPDLISDVRRADHGATQRELVKLLNGVPAYEIEPESGETLEPTAILDFEGTRYAVDEDATWGKFVELPDHRILRVDNFRSAGVRHILDVSVMDREYKVIQDFGTVKARAVSPHYQGMPREPRDIRIRFYCQGEPYVLSNEAYERGQWQLYIPDVGFFQIGIFLESIPVKLGRLEPMTGRPTDMKQVAVALPLADAVDAIDYARRAIESSHSEEDQDA